MSEKPWEKLGLSRAAWYRAAKPTAVTQKRGNVYTADGGLRRARKIMPAGDTRSGTTEFVVERRPGRPSKSAPDMSPEPDGKRAMPCKFQMWNEPVPTPSAMPCTMNENEGRLRFVTLTGQGDRAHLLNRSVDLATHVTDVASLLEMEDLAHVILVGHSYAGPVISGTAGRALEADSAPCLP